MNSETFEINPVLRNELLDEFGNDEWGEELVEKVSKIIKNHGLPITTKADGLCFEIPFESPFGDNKIGALKIFHNESCPPSQTIKPSTMVVEIDGKPVANLRRLLINDAPVVDYTDANPLVITFELFPTVIKI